VGAENSSELAEQEFRATRSDSCRADRILASSCTEATKHYGTASKPAASSRSTSRPKIQPRTTHPFA
jgi:hypothetical protein